MRILFTCRPVVGHFYPLVPVARALAGAGHDVAFATHPSLQPAIASAGFRHVAAGLGPSSREVADLMAQARDLSGEVLLEHIWGRLFAGLLARRMAGDLLALPEARC